MIRKEKNGLQWVEFEKFANYPIKQGVFTRHGGVSKGHLSSLNMGGTVGDEPSNPRKNQERMLCVLNLPVDQVYDVWQVHSADYVVAKNPRPIHSEHLKADIIISNQKNVTLVMRFADCVPIMVIDPVQSAIGIAHAGWIGTAKNVAGAMIKAMTREFHADPGNMVAGIGPSICQAHYPVGEEVVDEFSSQFPGQMDELFVKNGHKNHLDLWRANYLQLWNAGVREIETAQICTACHTEDWYSHRKEMGKTGRFGAVIQLL